MTIAKIKLIIIGVLLIFSIASCYNSQPRTSHFDFQKIDSISHEISEIYQTNPDSLVLLETQFENTYHRKDLCPAMVQYYSAMSEYYQYIKPDNHKALSYLNKATKILLELPEYTENNPYFYINAGNILSKQNLHIHAVKAYLSAFQFGKEIQDTNAIVASLDNVALSYQARQLCDSAEIFFQRAESYLSSSNRIQKAIHYNNIAFHKLQCQQTDKTIYYAKKAIHLLNIGQTEKQFQQTTSQQVIAKEMAKSHALIAKQYTNSSKDTAILYFEKALGYANRIDNIIDQTEYVLDYAKYLHKIEAYEDSNDQLEKQFSSLPNDNNYSIKVRLLYAICDNYSHLGNREKSSEYLFSCKLYQDSLIEQNANADQRNMEVELARLESDLLMSRLHEDLKSQEIRINKFRKILFLVFSLFLILITLTLYAFTKRKLTSTQKILTKRTITSIQKESTDKNTMSLKHKDEYIEKLEKLMIEDRIFLDKNLKQEDLARQLNTNMSYISKLFNSHYKMRFNDYINEYRIKEACMLIASKDHNHYTIDQLYNKVGFKTRSTFYNAFKKFTGSSPANYIKLNSNN